MCCYKLRKSNGNEHNASRKAVALLLDTVLGSVRVTGSRVVDELHFVLVDLMEEMILVYDVVHIHLGSVLDEPPKDAVEPDEKRHERKPSEFEAHGVNIIWIRLRP